MKACRDTGATGAHSVRFGRVLIQFDADSIARNLSDEQIALLTATPVRRDRFVEVVESKPAPAPFTRRGRREDPAPEPAPMPVPEGDPVE